ncbi:type II toxin-antitoxin system RelE/ParE family toxin [Fibrella forsythiae]|uniref:Type II toxin-antitoxin system RelE/ParE family toxin n=1 Tax=Fibrella forsythiae TaxID=2817061 RepID=A0ABS3JJJ2_9BACT|nr:type II toxin-antitoxin system RelE/ParE family toxin [Fibrella forsythiae]MBO0950163.1 type II toxin-antitoxin system RelE/ParE family toxin [Fibrella forsythiae]
MLVNFRHKGLQQYYEEGNGAKLPAQYLRKINRILDQLDAVTSTSDIQQMGSGIHKLTGDLADFWAITITPNYRVIFRFDNGDVYDVDYVDYH